MWSKTGRAATGRRTSEEAVQLHQELEVDILALGRLAVGALDVMAVQIDTCLMAKTKEFVSLLVQTCSGRLAEHSIAAESGLVMPSRGRREE